MATVISVYHATDRLASGFSPKIRIFHQDQYIEQSAPDIVLATREQALEAEIELAERWKKVHAPADTEMRFCN